MGMEGNLGKLYKEKYLAYLQDIELANKAMDESMLNVPNSAVNCDLYAIPSHNHQAFYAKIYEQDAKYNILYAKPIIRGLQYDEEIFMYHFKDAVKAEKNGNGILDGRVVCGVKTIDKVFVDKLFSSIMLLSEKHVSNEQSFILDGVFQAVRVFENGMVSKEIVYNDIDDISFEASCDDTELRWFYGSLYLIIEQIIGCGDNSSYLECDCKEYSIGSSVGIWKSYWSFYKKVYMGNVFKCAYCNTLWTRYSISHGWNEYYKEPTDTEVEESTALKSNNPFVEWKVEIGRDKLQLLERNVVEFLQSLSDYESKDLQLVEEYFTKVNDSDYVESVGLEEDGTYILYFRVRRVLKNFKRKQSLKEAAVSVANTIRKLKYREKN